MGKIKIMIIMPELFHGGAEKQFRYLIEGIDKKQFSINVVLEQSTDKRDVEMTEQYMERHKEITFYKLHCLHAEGLKIIRYTSFGLINLEMFFLIKKAHPDIILSYSSLGMKTMYLSKLLKSVPVYSERNAGTTNKSFYILNKKFIQCAGAIICNSIPALEKMKENSVDAIYIPNGIALCDRFSEERRDYYYILVPARIAQVKNQEIVIKALAHLDDKTVKVFFVGKNVEEEYGRYLNEIAKDLNVEKQIQFIPYTNNIIELYQKSNLVILPSKSEGFSSVILESYLYGRKCILSDIVMNRAVANKNQTFFQQNDYKELAEKIREEINLNQEDKLQQIKDNHDYVVNNFSIEKMVVTYQKLFLSLYREK